MSLPSMEIGVLHSLYASGELTPEQLVRDIHTALPDVADHNIWIHLLSDAELAPYLENLEGRSSDDLPLYGIPFAIKDNIDLAGVPTTAACKAFAHTPRESATVVDLLVTAGAIPIGKTNMDQFATGLVGTRSPEPWGACKNAFDKEYISGGSSSGSAVAVALGLVSFALGTDTAGSGRVPAAFNNLVGLKPSCGVISTHGVVPACRTLDCVSIFSLTASDANAVLAVAGTQDDKDPYSREADWRNLNRSFGALVNKPVIGVLQQAQLETFGDEEARSLYWQALEVLSANGFELREIDFEPFAAAARLLYEGPWVAERFAAVGEYLPDMLEVTRSVIGAGAGQSAADAFAGQYKLQELKRLANESWRDVDVIVTPTAAQHFTIEEVNADPVALNSRLGYYTNFMNLLDYAAVAAPVGFRSSGLPFGVTFFAPAFADLALLSLVDAMEDKLGLRLGATAHAKTAHAEIAAADGTITVAVCGAHLDGLPLNWQLTQRHAVLVEKTLSAPCYRFYALAGGPPFRPGLIRDETGGACGSIEVELWKMPAAYFGSFVTGIPQPLGIGKLELADGRWVTSFICEAYATADAEDITQFGGWRAYLRSKRR